VYLGGRLAGRVCRATAGGRTRVRIGRWRWHSTIPSADTDADQYSVERARAQARHEMSCILAHMFNFFKL